MLTNCPICEKEFYAFGVKTYCSVECRKKAQMDKIHPQLLKNCIACNVSFLTNKAFQKCCSAECRRTEYYKKNKEKIRAQHKARYDSDPKRASEKSRLWKEANKEKYLISLGKCHDEARFSGNKAAVLERDGYKCTECESTKSLIIHHIDESGSSEEPNNEMDNLKTLCRSCHMKKHKTQPKRQFNFEMLKCEYCDKEFKVSHFRLKDRKIRFCSRECRTKSGSYVRAD